MYVERLQLKNFKNFTDLDITFEKGVNLIVGINGSGKTAILEALNLVIKSKFTTSPSLILDTVNSNNYNQYLSIRNGKRLEYFSIKFELNVEERKIKNEIHVQKSANLTTVNQNFKKIGDQDYYINALEIDNPNQELSLVRFFGVNRIVDFSDVNPGILYDPYEPKTQGYIGCLLGYNYQKMITEWFKNTSVDTYSKVRKGIKSDIKGLSNIENLSKDLSKIFFEIKDFDVYYSNGYDDMMLVIGNKELPLKLYSQGTIYIYQLFFDLVWRTSILNPWMSWEDIKLKTTGIVLIDEIELHLHPKWQAKVIQTLQDLFPNVQFFITTHSPTVVANFQNGTLFTLEDDSIQKVEKHYFGRRVNDVLKNVLDATDRHVKTLQKINELFQWIENKKSWKKAEERLEELKNEIGAEDVELLQAQSMLDYYKSLQD